jgi:hypothetical protein
MPPRGRGRAKIAEFTEPDSILGKRKNDPAFAVPASNRRGPLEHQSSFANFMNKKGDTITRLLEEKGVSEENESEHFAFKSDEWNLKREK